MGEMDVDEKENNEKVSYLISFEIEDISLALALEAFLSTIIETKGRIVSRSTILQTPFNICNIRAKISAMDKPIIWTRKYLNDY